MTIRAVTPQKPKHLKFPSSSNETKRIKYFVGNNNHIIINLPIHLRLLGLFEIFQQHQTKSVIPAKIKRLTNAGSIAALMLTTEALVADITEESKGVRTGGHGGMGDAY